MHLTVTSNDDRVIQIDVEPNETIENIKALIEVQMNIPNGSQILRFHGQILQDSSKTLNELGIHEHDLILVEQQRSAVAPPPPPAITQAREGMTLYDIPPNCSAKLLLDIMEKNPQLLVQIEQSNPSLATALKSKTESTVRFALIQQQMEVASKKYAEEQELIRLNNNPFSEEAQAKIAENIRLGNVQQNMEMAMESMPEAFGSVSMLYINCEVNATPVKAFVDSGAQSTIMSTSCAERCGIMRLVDTRYSGQAVGVGTARIVGRVHMAALKIGDTFYNCSFTILDQQGVDFLFGLDMLKRHQCCINLKKNVLELTGSNGHTEVAFLPEHEIPAKEKMGNLKPSANNADSSSSAAAASSSTATAASSGAAVSADQEKINHLMALGFNEQQARQALASCHGNPDLAAQLLFESGHS